MGAFSASVAILFSYGLFAKQLGIVGKALSSYYERSE
jgi:hypothetical protein